MPLPLDVRVKLSSEAAESVALTPVVVREMPFGELLEQIAGATGAEPARVREILKRGSLVSGATRFRWQGWECGEEELEQAIGALPQPEPWRPFAAERCERVILIAGAARIEISRAAAEQRRLFRRRSFWQCLMAEAAAPAYVTYHYKDRADHYRAMLTAEQRARLQAGAALLRFPGLAKQIRRAALEQVELIAGR